jgi:hypothetical protein
MDELNEAPSSKIKAQEKFQWARFRSRIAPPDWLMVLGDYFEL